MKLNKYPHYCLILYLIVWALLAINPMDRFTWFLENLLPFVFVPLLVFTYKKFKFSNLAYTLITIFIILHAIGAHYTYSEVPFISSFLDVNFQRDHYDRLVHFSFGLLMLLPARELIVKKAKLSGFWSYLLPITMITTGSAAYEIIEWATAIIVQPENAIAWLGIQGDFFDAEKDMMVAFTGSMTTTILMAINKVKNKKE